jgi:predicted O-methyltransferase YrrM
MRLQMTKILSRLPGTQLLAIQKQKLQLLRIRKARCDSSPLSRQFNQFTLKEILALEHLRDEWKSVEAKMASLQISDKAVGVNPGDRRALFYLLRSLRSASVLEIGTATGASTVHAAAALMLNHAEDRQRSHRLTTVDVLDVNDPQSKPWVTHGLPYSPKEMVAKVGATDSVTFVVDSSLHYLSTCRDSYDFIFLDGDHAAKTVYEEIPRALRVLKQGGLIVLHDYFPDLRPLWSDGSVIPGPWLATERLRNEGVTLAVVPLGELPWRTKLESHATSLAMVLGT